MQLQFIGEGFEGEWQSGQGDRNLRIEGFEKTRSDSSTSICMEHLWSRVKANIFTRMIYVSSIGGVFLERMGESPKY